MTAVLTQTLRRETKRPLVVFAAAFAAACAMVFVVFGRQSMVGGDIDPYAYGAMGRSLAAGNGFAGDGSFGTLLRRRAPLYPLVIGGVYWLVGERPRAVLLLHCVLFAAMCTLVYDLGRRLFNERTGIVAAALCIVNPMLLRYLPTLHLETMLMFLFTLLVWTMVRFHQRPAVAAGVAVGLAAGAASLAKTVALPIVVLFAAGIVLAARRIRRRGGDALVPWKPIVAIAVALAAAITPWTVRNYRASGHFVLVSTGTSDAFLRGFIFSRAEFALLRKPPYTDAENESNAYFEALAQAKGTAWQRDDYETDQILNAEAKRRLVAEPVGVMRKSLVGLLTFWYELTSLKNSLLALVLAVGAWALALVGWRRARREGCASWLLLMPILYMNISLALLLALGRYSVPILPALLVLSGFGVDTLLTRRQADPIGTR